MFGENVRSLGNLGSTVVLNDMHSSTRDLLNYDRADEIYQVHRGKMSDKNPGENYGGIFYRNSFRVIGGPITLLKLGFFGPKDADVGTFSVVAHIRLCSWDQNSPDSLPWCGFIPLFWPLRSRSKYNVTPSVKATAKKLNCSVLKGQNLWLEFDPTVQIPAETWVEIAFSLSGNEKTGSMASGTQETSVTVDTCDGPRQFEFFTGSCQMPSIEFSVTRRAVHSEDCKTSFL